MPFGSLISGGQTRRQTRNTDRHEFAGSAGDFLQFGQTDSPFSGGQTRRQTFLGRTEPLLRQTDRTDRQTRRFQADRPAFTGGQT